MDIAIEEITAAFKAAYYKYKDPGTQNSDAIRAEGDKIRNETLDNLVKVTHDLHLLIKKNCVDGSAPNHWHPEHKQPFARFSRYLDVTKKKVKMLDMWRL